MQIMNIPAHSATTSSCTVISVPSNVQFSRYAFSCLNTRFHSTQSLRSITSLTVGCSINSALTFGDDVASPNCCMRQKVKNKNVQHSKTKTTRRTVPSRCVKPLHLRATATSHLVKKQHLQKEPCFFRYYYYNVFASTSK